MQLLSGRYEALKAIASGGMATVHLGRAVGVGGFERLVAIKVMHAHIAEDPEFVAMFLDEARLAARIRHPNVVATIDVQDADDSLFLVMELVDGPSLRRLLKVAARRGIAIPHGVIVRVVLDTLAGLHAAHELTGDDGEPLHLIHRDVTPANILVGADGVVRLTDFGVARAEARLSSTRGGQLKGKIPYMPPEQLLGDPMDHRCDVYAAGAVLWEALVGRRLFQADSDGRLVKMIIQGPEQSPREVDSAVPAALDRACMRALASEPGDRYATAADFAVALEEAAESDGFSIATTRAVAAFVELTRAHRKLDPKELAALKRGSSLEAGAEDLPSVPSAKASAPSVSGPAVVPGSPGGERDAGLVSAPTDVRSAVPSPTAEEEPSIRSGTNAAPDELSSVTATEHTISGAREAPPVPRRRTAVMVGALAAAAAALIVAGLLLSRGADTAASAPASDASTGTAVAPVTPSVATPPVPSSEPSAAPADAVPEASAAPVAPSASASAVVPPPQTPPGRPPTRPRPPVTKPTEPKPGSTTYNPPQL